MWTCGVVWCPSAKLLFPQRKLKDAAWTGFSNDPSCVSLNKSLCQDGCYWGHWTTNTCCSCSLPQHMLLQRLQNRM